VAKARTQQATSVGHAAADARVAALLARHGAALMRVARQASLCHDDAADALQRALEIYVRRLDTVELATEAAWLKVVVRNEAYAIRRARGDCVADRDIDLDTVAAAGDRSIEEQILSSDRVGRSAEALRALKPDEARALMLKAHGLSYEEIGRRCGWTYTKVNRCITEGRRRFMEVYAGLETGATCERFAPALEALAAGTASSEQLVELRPHLRRCTACRATVRDLHLSRLHRRALLAPIPLFGWLGGRARAMPDPMPAPLPKLTDVLELPTATPAGNAPGLVGRLRESIVHLLSRTPSADVATGVQIMASLGSGRAATIGTIIGLCVSGLGAGAVCVVSGVAPIFGSNTSPKTVPSERPRPPVRAAREAAARQLSAELVSLRARTMPTPAPRATRRAGARSRRPSAAADPSQGRTPTSHQHAPISPVARAATGEFDPAAATGTGVEPAPAAAPATGGGEFTP
jgi:RNA polymerase sigma factor (sigma-70 family)